MKISYDNSFQVKSWAVLCGQTPDANENAVVMITLYEVGRLSADVPKRVAAAENHNYMLVLLRPIWCVTSTPGSSIKRHSPGRPPPPPPRHVACLQRWCHRIRVTAVCMRGFGISLTGVCILMHFTRCTSQAARCDQNGDISWIILIRLEWDLMTGLRDWHVAVNKPFTICRHVFSGCSPHFAGLVLNSPLPWQVAGRENARIGQPGIPGQHETLISHRFSVGLIYAMVAQH